MTQAVSCKIEPLFAKVILQREKLKAGSIIIPDSIEKRNAPCEGMVLAVGPNAEGVEVGNKVLFGQHAGAWITVQEEEYFICLDEDIHGIIRS